MISREQFERRLDSIVLRAIRCSDTVGDRLLKQLIQDEFKDDNSYIKCLKFGYAWSSGIVERSLHRLIKKGLVETRTKVYANRSAFYYVAPNVLDTLSKI